MKAGGRRSREGSRCAVTEGELGVSAGRVAQAVDAVEAQGMERVRVCLGSLGPLPWRDLGQRCRDYSEGHLGAVVGGRPGGSREQVTAHR